MTAYGTINSGTALTGIGNPPAGITAGYLGGTTPPANPPLVGLNGDVVVNNFANITAAAGDGIRAYNYGIGDVTVTDNTGTIVALGGASPTNGYGVGIGAYNYGTGNITILTVSGTAIQSGGSGIAAVNEAPTAPSSSTVSVIAFGTITPGIIPTGSGSPAAGILAGYNFNGSPDSNVAGNLVIDDYASISAPNGTDGIRGFNYGIGDITIAAEVGTTISGGRYGIGAIGHDGGDAHVINSATVSGATAGIFAQTTGTGTISIVNSSAGAIQSSGNSSSPAISIVDDPTGSAVINNSGIIEASQNSAAALAILEVGSSVTISNSGQIIGDVNLSSAIFNNNAGADWEFAGTNIFAAGVNVINNAGTIHSQGSSGVIQITAGSLDIMGAISGTVNLAIGNGATLELNGPGSAGETVTFLGTQGTLKLDHSLSSPFIGQISNLAGTPLIHDSIDLADLVWNGTASAQYAASTATSGVLTVNDGNGHTEIFNLVNYTGAGSFFVQNDGQGGTLVFDPPATTVGSAPITMTTDAEEPVLSISNVTNGGSGPQAELLSSFESDSVGAGRVEKLPIDRVMHSDSDMAGWHFAFDQARSSSPLSPHQTSWQSEGTELPINQLGNVVTQQIVPTLSGAAGDFFAFRQETASNLTTPSDQVADKIDIDAKYAELQAIIHSSRNEHNIPDHDGSITLSNIPPSHHVEGFMLNHL